MLIIGIFYRGNFQQKALIINIVLRLRMSTYAYENQPSGILIKHGLISNLQFRQPIFVLLRGSRIGIYL